MKKETQELRLYRENDMRRVYFATGTGLVAGSVIGRICGIAQALKTTQGKKKALEYFEMRAAKSAGAQCALASCAFALGEYIAEKLPGAAQRALQMLG